MNTIRFAAALALALTAVACGSSEPGKPGAGADKTDGAAKPGAAPAGGTPVDTLPLVADIPAGVESNGGAPGFHASDDSVFVMIRAASDTDPKDFEGAKANAEAILFKKWIKSEKTADGWTLTYVGTGMDMSGKEYDNYNFGVRRKIGAASYECYGAVKKQADLEKNVKICQSLKPAS